MIRREDWAELLEKIREEKMLSIQEFAVTEVGIAFLTYKKIINGDTTLAYNTLRKVEQYLEEQER